jgi:hypothetical protein
MLVCHSQREVVVSIVRRSEGKGRQYSVRVVRCSQASFKGLLEKAAEVGECDDLALTG